MASCSATAIPTRSHENRRGDTRMKFIPYMNPLGPHGVGFAMLDADNPLSDIRVIAMGVVKPANDDVEFYREKAKREYLEDLGIVENMAYYLFHGYPLPPGPPQ